MLMRLPASSAIEMAKMVSAATQTKLSEPPQTNKAAIATGISRSAALPQFSERTKSLFMIFLGVDVGAEVQWVTDTRCWPNMRRSQFQRLLRVRTHRTGIWRRRQWRSMRKPKGPATRALLVRFVGCPRIAPARLLR